MCYTSGIKIRQGPVMVKVDLITGFLGAGKTTFIKRYAEYLLRQGLRIGILVYDHGAVNVDVPMLQDLRSEACELESIIGDCDTDSHRRRFRTKLISMGMSGYDRILIEPSGIFDMDEFFDVLHDTPLDQWFEAGSVITIVDARLENDLPKEADFYLASQAAWAGRIVLSRAQLATDEEIQDTLHHLQQAAGSIHGEPLSEDRIIGKDWDELTEDDFQEIMAGGYHPADYVKTIAGSRTGFSSFTCLNPVITRARFRRIVHELFQHECYGDIFRVKGFLEEDGKWYQLNATGRDILIEETAKSQEAVIVIGSGLQDAAIRYLFDTNTGGIVRIFLIRHGQTRLNTEAVLQGRSDEPMDEQGIRQAENAAAWFRKQDIRFDAVYSSPLIRAARTAEIVSGGSEIVKDDRLLEMDYGPYEGISYYHLPPEAEWFFKDFVNHPAPEGMEPLQHVTSRMGLFLEDIVQNPPARSDRTILVATHAIAMKGALEYLTPDAGGSYWSKHLGNCAVYMTEWDGNKFTRPVECAVTIHSQAKTGKQNVQACLQQAAYRFSSGDNDTSMSNKLRSSV